MHGPARIRNNKLGISALGPGSSKAIPRSSGNNPIREWYTIAQGDHAEEIGSHGFVQGSKPRCP